MSTPIRHTEDGRRCELLDPCALPQAAGFLWNHHMMIHMNCRGYAVAQFLQPEPAKYAHPPLLEAKTFMHPEQPYFAHHPGRFFYLKDEDSGGLFSVPFEPVRRQPDRFVFSIGQSDLRWEIDGDGLRIELRLDLPVDDVAELWSLAITNRSGRPRRLSVYPYFPVGYASWMNQGGEYRADLGGIVCTAVAPYQKVKDYFRSRSHKDKTFLIGDHTPDAWEANQAAFEGWGGLTAPAGVTQERLAGGDARYELPTCALQFRRTLGTGDRASWRFVFGPARDDEEIRLLRGRYLAEGAFERTAAAAAAYVAQGAGCIQISTPDPTLDHYVNHWLPRQTFYQGDVNRLTTDPQTRNFLQDAMGTSYVRPATTRAAVLRALAQQEASGSMPEGILLAEGAELKYINLVPHMDHCVWLPVALSAYLDETDDFALLEERLPFANEAAPQTVAEHIDRAMRWLLAARDARGLNYIAEGDWCDPMNMVGYKGKGVSGWLTLGTAWALQLWARISADAGRSAVAAEFQRQAEAVNAAVNRHLWDGDWYARGITDDGVVFGVKTDQEGAIFINPQSWALLSGAADPEQRRRLIAAVEQKLDTPYGPMKLAPPYMGMREDVGRLTQKFPGIAENGSIYNHAAIFYSYGLYQVGEADRAYQVLRKMLPGPDDADLCQRGQLPVFIPNYYRGACREYPRTAGRSSQLFNTGTVAWYYRCLVDGLFGLRGCRQGLRIAPHLPSSWNRATVRRQFRGATIDVTYQRTEHVRAVEIRIDGALSPSGLLTPVVPGRTYAVEVLLAKA